MKFKLFFLLILSGLFFKAQAQDRPKAFLGVYGGLSSPTGNFTKSDYNDVKSGYAKTGYTFGIDGVFYLGKHFGLGTVVSLNDYKLKTSSLAEGYVNDFATDASSVNTKHFKAVNFLVGPYFTFGSGKLKLDIRALAGISSATLPEMKVVLLDLKDGKEATDPDPYEVNNSFTQNKSMATGFAYQVGLGLRYNILTHLGLALRADYFSSKSNFSVSYDNFSGNTGRHIDRYHETIQGINATFGIFYQFKR